MRIFKITIRFFAEEVPVPNLLRCVGKAFGFQVDHLFPFFFHKRFRAQRSKQLVLFSWNIGEDAGKRRYINSFVTSYDTDADGIKIHLFFSKIKLQQDSDVGVKVNALIVRIKDEVPQRVKNCFSVIEQFIVLRDVGMMANHYVCAQLQEFEVPITGIGAGKAGKLFAAMGDDNTPSAF